MKHNQNYYLKTWRFDLYQRPSSEELVLSPSGSWHNGKTLCQESGRMRGSVGSCPHHGSWPVVLPRRKFGVRLQEHRTEVKSKTDRTFTRSLHASSLTEHNKSALTDHATQEKHVINWSQATVIDREPERFTRWIKETIHIRKEGQQAMNRDKGSYQLSHAYNRFLDTASSRCVKNRKNWVGLSASSDEGLW